MVERGAGMSIDSTLHVDKRIHTASFSYHRSLKIFTGKGKLTFPNSLFVPDRGAWPELSDGNGYPVTAREMTAKEKRRYRMWKDR
jgi:hypothetical protein